MSTAHLIVPLMRGLDNLIVHGISEKCVGCYAVFGPDGRCLYIGASTQLAKRIESHWINQNDGHGKQWRCGGSTDSWVKQPFAPEGSTLHIWWSEFHEILEYFLILRFSPSGNRQVNKPRQRYVRKAL